MSKDIFIRHLIFQMTIQIIQNIICSKIDFKLNRKRFKNGKRITSVKFLFAFQVLFETGKTSFCFQIKYCWKTLIFKQKKIFLKRPLICIMELAKFGKNDDEFRNQMLRF